jgi:hypothetical protein
MARHRGQDAPDIPPRSFGPAGRNRPAVIIAKKTEEKCFTSF